MTIGSEDRSNLDEIGQNLRNHENMRALKKDKTQGVLAAYIKVSKYWISLDSESTVDIFKDKLLLKIIRKILEGDL